MPVLFRLPWGGGDVAPVDPTKCDPVLSNNSWEKIAAASEAGLASTHWSIGDEIDVKLDGEGYNETITLEIVDFDHDDLADNTGKAGITFVMKECLSEKVYMNETVTALGGWGSCYVRNTLVPKILAAFPEDLRNRIKLVKKYSMNANQPIDGDIMTTEDTLFLLSSTELGKQITYVGSSSISGASGARVNKQGVVYEGFSSGTVIRNRKMDWWLRQPMPFSGTYLIPTTYPYSEKYTSVNSTYKYTFMVVYAGSECGNGYGSSGSDNYVPQCYRYAPEYGFPDTKVYTRPIAGLCFGLCV